MSNENTSDTAAEPKVKVVKHLDARIADAREDVEKAEAKLAKLLTEQANRALIENVGIGDEVRFEYGRGEKRRVLTGTVVAVGNDEKQGRLLAVTYGEGIDVETVKIRAVDILFPGEGESYA
jgi:hypothetical protein